MPTSFISSQKCSTCKRERHIVFFNPSTVYATGYHPKCKDCCREASRKSYHKRKNKPKITPPDQIICSTCKLQKPKEEFGILNSSPSGYSSRCKKCTNEILKQSYQNNKWKRRKPNDLLDV